jgi:NADP-dependent 3-hydroxy acid dehydrogenase YdfG
MHAAQAELDGLAALVTGASSGIGEATAQELAARGASVTLAARCLDRLTILASKISSGGGRALALAIDVTDQAQAISAVERTVEAFGRLDIVINNAGVMLLGLAQPSTTSPSTASAPSASRSAPDGPVGPTNARSSHAGNSE